MKVLNFCVALGCLLQGFHSSCQSAFPPGHRSAFQTQRFHQLPEKITCSIGSLQNLFDAAINSSIQISVNDSLILEGIVLAKAAITPAQLSINIRCNNYQHALLNLSRIMDADGAVSYIGRIVNPRQRDVLLLWQEDGQYAFIRQKQLLAMVE